MVHLATHRAPEGLRASQDIAAATKVPARYLSKIMKDLVEAGLVNSRRGPSGGFELAREAGAITVLEVVNAVDPIRRITTCPLGIPAHGTTLCRLHRRLDDTIAMVQQTLAAATIAEMTEPGRGAGGAKCFFPTIGGRPKRERRG